MEGIDNKKQKSQDRLGNSLSLASKQANRLSTCLEHLILALWKFVWENNTWRVTQAYFNRSTKKKHISLNSPHRVEAIDTLTIDIIAIASSLRHQAENLGVWNHYYNYYFNYVGRLGTTQQECESHGCCWNPKQVCVHSICLGSTVHIKF